MNTNRLRILPWSRGDAKDFFLLTQDEGFKAFPITNYDQANIEAALQWIDQEIEIHQTTGLGKMAVREGETNELIGMCGLTPWDWQGEHLIDLTYRFRKESWGKGYGWEAASAMVYHAFNDLGLKEITATITPDNTPSINLAIKLGMKFDQDIVLKSVNTRLFRLTNMSIRAD
jgi:[ribosomal protein S5]-alanine N-acetyltransferase